MAQYVLAKCFRSSPRPGQKQMHNSIPACLQVSNTLIHSSVWHVNVHIPDYSASDSQTVLRSHTTAQVLWQRQINAVHLYQLSDISAKDGMGTIKMTSSITASIGNVWTKHRARSTAASKTCIQSERSPHITDRNKRKTITTQCITQCIQVYLLK